MKKMKFSIQQAGAMIVASCMFQGCANAPLPLAAVGPAPTGQHARASEGALVVYSATEDHTLGDGPRYFPHSGYTIQRENGEFLQYVPNHIGSMDEQPKRVTLPAGAYTIIARSDSHGRVAVPVVIAPRKVTEVHLDGAKNSKLLAADDSAVVRLPNGQIVGWRAGDVANP